VPPARRERPIGGHPVPAEIPHPQWIRSAMAFRFSPWRNDAGAPGVAIPSATGRGARWRQRCIHDHAPAVVALRFADPRPWLARCAAGTLLGHPATPEAHVRRSPRDRERFLCAALGRGAEIANPPSVLSNLWSREMHGCRRYRTDTPAGTCAPFTAWICRPSRTVQWNRTPRVRSAARAASDRQSVPSYP
jgi:hypothetical protein